MVREEYGKQQGTQDEWTGGGNRYMTEPEHYGRVESDWGEVGRLSAFGQT